MNVLEALQFRLGWVAYQISAGTMQKLATAVATGKLAAVKDCIRDGVDVNMRPEHVTLACCQALHFTVHVNWCRVDLLITYTIGRDNITLRWTHRAVLTVQANTAVMFAAGLGHVKIAEELLCAGADLACRNQVWSQH